jgi:hypothetical protein
MCQFAGEADIVITCMTLTNETVNSPFLHVFISSRQSLLDFDF